MASGDVKRGADVEIVVVPASEKFETAWGKAIETFQSDYKRAVDKVENATASRQGVARESAPLMLEGIEAQVDLEFRDKYGNRR